MKEMDAESLQTTGRRRGRCLNVFLVTSITFLLVAVTAVAAGGAMVVMELRSQLESSRPSVQLGPSGLKGDTSFPAFKMQNFVYLEASSSELKTYTMRLAPVNYAAVSSVGSNFVFDSNQYSLKPRKMGTYFIYIELNLTCTYNCSAGLLRVHVGDKLTCKVELPADSAPVSRKCWTVTWLEEQGLLTQMTVPETGLENWKLELSGSGVGMFLVD